MKRIEPNVKSQPQTHASGIFVDQDLFISGQVGIDRKTGNTVEGIAKQASVSLANLVSVVEAAGGTVADVAKLTIYVADMAALQKEMPGFMAAFSETFTDEHIPAMTLVGVTALISPDYLLEIEGQAKIGASLK